MKSTEEDVLYRHVCGVSTEEEKSSLESRFFVDDELFDRMLETEDDLVDAYVRSSLERSLVPAFEKRMAESPRLRERVAFARALVALPTAGPRVRRLPLALAAAIVLLLGGTWAALQLGSLRRESRELTAETGRLRQELARLQESSKAETSRLEETLQNAARDTVPPGRVAAFALAGSLTRGGADANRIVLAGGTETAVLDLPLASKRAERYRVTIETAEGRRIALLEGLPGPVAPARTLRVSLPATLLADGDYVLSVSGASATTEAPLADYVFRVVRK